MNLFTLRHTAKEILALATLDLFPSVQLIGGEVDEIGFYYDFLFPKEILTLFSERELLHLEDRMIAIIHENHPIKALDMMRENGAHYLDHLKQPFRAAEILDQAANIITLIEIGSFRDLCPPPFLKSTGELKVFKLLRFETDEGRVRIYGTAFEARYELKKFIKQCKEAIKTDPLVIGPKKEYFLPFEGEWIYLPKGGAILERLRAFWEKEHAGFERLAFSEQVEKRGAHASVMEKKRWGKTASLSLFEGDWTSIKCETDQELFETLISSLHFIEKAFKIFAFESKVYCLEPKKGWLADLLKQSGFAFEYVQIPKGEGHISIRVVDGYGRQRPLSYIEVERKMRVVHRSLFHSIKEWVAHMIERGVES